ncbi:glycerate kinase [Rhizobium helianthi]|uniref:Glycerate kinase n=1 Tax=Rhizobium helianthi TaxID=1132695 RepID=A0ABW4M3J3_9HYPH
MKHRDLLISLFNAAVQAAEPAKGMARFLPSPPASGRTVVIGAGKGAAQMAAALESLWPSPLEGVVVTRYGYGCKTRNIEVLEAAHPVPDTAGLHATERLFAAISSLGPDDLVIALICGGGSALLPAPPVGLSLADEIALNEVLLASGAPISVMNTVRKHVSRIKGGRLAAATRAKVVSLIVSDIPGDNAAHVASGPTVPDPSTREEALALVDHFGLHLPDNVMAHLRSPAAEAPGPEDPAFQRNAHHIIASAGISLEAAASIAEAKGYTPYLLSDSMEGESRDIALAHAALVRETIGKNRPFRRPAVLLSGGETTVTLRTKSGKGGRNSEFALALALALEGQSFCALAADTDGIDGFGDHAGAFCDGTTATRLRRLGLDGRQRLAQNDSFTAFEALGDLFVTGPTGTNVNDFRAIVID